MIEKAEVYNKINTKGYLRFELNESNEKEYLKKLISVQDALKEVEQKNKDNYENKIEKINGLKEDVKCFYNYLEDAKESEDRIEKIIDQYIDLYIKPLENLLIRKEKLQLQVVPYITDGFWKRFKAIFTYEGRAKLNIEKQFNKELKSISKEIKDLENIKMKNQLSFSDAENDIDRNIISNVELNIINENTTLTSEQIYKLKSDIRVSKGVVIKDKRSNFINKILDYIEVCTDYSQIADLNVEEHYKFKNTEYKLYLQEGYIDNDFNSVVKYYDIIKSEKNFVGEQAANKLIEGIQECILELEAIINNTDELKLA